MIVVYWRVTYKMHINVGVGFKVVENVFDRSPPSGLFKLYLMQFPELTLLLPVLLANRDPLNVCPIYSSYVL